MNDEKLPLIDFIATALHWLEELLIVISGPAITFGLLIGLIDLLTDGKLLLDAPSLLFAWAISIAVGADGQLVAAWYRVGTAARHGKWGAMFGFVILGTILIYVAYVSALVFAYQQAYNIPMVAALAKLNISQSAWLIQRTAVTVMLAAVSGLLRYRKPQALSIEEQKAKLAEAADLAAFKRNLTTQQVRGLMDAGKTLIGKNTLISTEPQENNIPPASQEIYDLPSVATEVEVERINHLTYWKAQDMIAYVRMVYDLSLDQRLANETIREYGKGMRSSKQPGQPYIAKRQVIKNWITRQPWAKTKEETLAVPVLAQME